MADRFEKTISQKARAEGDLFDYAFTVRKHQLKCHHPDWSEAELKQETLRLIELGCK